MNVRTRIIQKLVNYNEAIFFYPKLKRFYDEMLRGKPLKVIDVGANKGQSIAFFQSINPGSTIYAFEPNKKLFAALTVKHKSNSSVKLHNVGVSNDDGQLEFNENILDETSSFETLNLDSKYLKRKAKVLGVSKEKIIVNRYNVDVIKLSSFIKELPEDFFDVLKIDVEGHELQVLQGLFTEDGHCPIRFIQLESHNNDMYLSNARHGEIEELLHANGFLKAAEVKHGFGDFTEIIYENTSEA